MLIKILKVFFVSPPISIFLKNIENKLFSNFFFLLYISYSSILVVLHKFHTLAVMYALSSTHQEIGLMLSFSNYRSFFFVDKQCHTNSLIDPMARARCQ